MLPMSAFIRYPQNSIFFKKVCRLLIAFRYEYSRSTHFWYEDWAPGFLRHISAPSFSQSRKPLLRNPLAKSPSNKPLISICLTIRDLKASSRCYSKTRPREWKNQSQPQTQTWTQFGANFAVWTTSHLCHKRRDSAELRIIQDDEV